MNNQVVFNYSSSFYPLETKDTSVKYIPKIEYFSQMETNLLLISNSTNAGEAYLGWPRPYLEQFFTELGIKEVTFVPYAGVSMGYDVYAKKVADVLADLGVKLVSVHTFKNHKDAIEKAQCILVGGGNTFHLVYEMYRNGVMDAIRAKTLSGTPYVGWSAGSNVACPGLYTTNDMPIVEPESFKTLNLVPFQINPHYLDANPQGHGGETREDRIKEFMVVNPNTYVVGLREATLLRVRGNRLELIGKRKMRVFKGGVETKEYEAGQDLSFLMQK